MKFQWSFGGHWIDCTRENNALITQRRKTPQMEPLFMANDYGEIWGVLETGTLNFRVHGDQDIIQCHVRIAPTSRELPFFAVIKPSGPFILDYNTSRELFNDDGTPRASVGPLLYGTETFKTEGGSLFQVINGTNVPRRYKQVDITRGHYEDMTRTRFKWKFKGPLRWSKMFQAVHKVIENTGDEQKRAELKEVFDSFNPSEDNTEYGPYQFPDYLSSVGLHEIAFQVAEEFKKIPVDDWKHFDAITNVRIEEARSQERPVVVIDAEGQKYMIVFDIGTGASGNSAVMIRPTRYQKIIESIEEQFHEMAEETHKRAMRELFDLLSQHGIAPRLFIMALMTSEDTAFDRLISDPELRTTAQGILQGLHSSTGHLSTRMQQFMPALLEKFKECDIALDEQENLHPKTLCPKVSETLREGLSIPESQHRYCTNFKELVQFIQKEQSWKIKKGRNICDICSKTSMTTLTHCGTASACLKCWSDSLVKTNMSCPFCRGTVGNGDLKIAADKPKTPQKKGVKSRKRKRESYQSPEDILQEIHKDTKYANISISSKEPMRKWFTILLRRKLIGIGQMPRNDQGKKEFTEAMKIFKLLP